MRFPREATYARQRVRERVRACALAYRRGPKGTFDPNPGIRKIWTKTRNTPQPLEREKYSPIRIFDQGVSPERPARSPPDGASGPNAPEPDTVFWTAAQVVPDSGTAYQQRKERQHMTYHCGLKSADSYCSAHPGLCCASCDERRRCLKDCLNNPKKCGYSVCFDMRGQSEERR